MFFHERQSAIKLDSSKLFPTTLCRVHSVCVCGRSANSHPDALHFFRSLVARMKDIFSQTKTHISVQRLLLQKGHIVLKFRKKPPEDDCEVDPTLSHEVFLYVGYINFKTWLFSGVHLLKILDCSTNGYMELAPWCCVEEKWGTNHGVRTIVQFAAEHFQFGFEYTLKIYKLVDDDARLPEEFMVGTCVEVEAFEGIGEFTCWKGSQTESQLRRKETQRTPGVKRPAAPFDPNAADKEDQKKRRRTQKGKGKGPSNNQLSFSALLALTDSSEPKKDKVHSDDLDNLLQSAWDWDSPFPSPSECGQSNVGRGSDSGDAPSEAFVLQEGEEEEDAFVEDTLVLVEDDKEEDSFSYAPTTPLSQTEEDQILNELLQERSDDSDAETRTRPTETETPAGENAKKDKRDGSSSSSSSTSSTGSSSSSSNDDGPNQGALPRKTPLSEFLVDYGSHEIHYNRNGEYMRAHCSQHVDCRRQRTVKPSKFAFHNRGQGRPIGLLTAWLDSAASFETREDHVKARPAPLADRKIGRQKFKGTQEGLDFLKFERDQSQDTESEPEDIL